MKKIYLLVSILIIGIAVSACQPKTFKNKYKSVIMSSNEIIDDLVKSIGGNFIETSIAIRKGNDPHSYTATEKDIIRITNSSLIIYNGGNLEGRLEWALSKIGNITPAVSIIDCLPKDKLIYDKDKNDNNETVNPHFWHDPLLWKTAAHFIADNLASMNNVNQQIYFQNEEVFLYILDRLNSYIKEQVKKIPEEKRIIVTEHDAFAYFGRAYGFETLYLQGASTSSEVSSADINDLADVLIEKNVTTLFLEATLPDKNIRLLQSTLKARGHFVKIGGTLYSDTLGYNNNYEAMMRHNIDTIVNALSSK